MPYPVAGNNIDDFICIALFKNKVFYGKTRNKKVNEVEEIKKRWNDIK